MRSLTDYDSFAKTRITSYQGRPILTAQITLRALVLEGPLWSRRLTIFPCLRFHQSRPPMGSLTNRARSRLHVMLLYAWPKIQHLQYQQDWTVYLMFQARRIQMSRLYRTNQDQAQMALQRDSYQLRSNMQPPQGHPSLAVILHLLASSLVHPWGHLTRQWKMDVSKHKHGAAVSFVVHSP